jgi:beta-barrel assembly-enhancing protease
MMNRIVPVFLLAALGGATGLTTGCGGRLSESQEYYVGRSVSANAMFDSGGSYTGLHEDKELEEYVALVGLTVALESDRPETFKGYYFGVLKSGDVNAFAAPGGFIFVTVGALKLMETEDELAGVLAHEIAHVNLRHPEDHANRSANQQGLMSILGLGSAIAGAYLQAKGQGRSAEDLQKLSQGLGKTADEFTKELMVKGYGRESELAADALGVRILCREGVRYNPDGLKAFISRLPKKDRGAWATHPALEGRIQAIDDEIKKSGSTAAVDPVRTARFKAATARLR